MKKTVPVLCLLAICVACGKTPKKLKKAPTLKQAIQKDSSVAGDGPYFQYGSPVLLQYDRFLNQLNDKEVGNGYQAIVTFHKLFDNQSPDICDTAYYLLDLFHGRLGVYLTGHMEQDSINYDDLVSVDANGQSKPLSKKQKTIAGALTANGFRIEEEEGMPYITQDHNFLFKHLSRQLSPAMQQYQEQLSKEDKEGFQNDAGLVISPELLVDRTLWYETFIQKYPIFIYNDNVNGTYFYLRATLMTGMDNTPVKENDSISEYFRTVYSHLQTKYPKSTTNAAVLPYYNALIKNDTTMVRKIRDSLDEQMAYD